MDNLNISQEQKQAFIKHLEATFKANGSASKLSTTLSSMLTDLESIKQAFENMDSLKDEYFGTQEQNALSVIIDMIDGMYNDLT